MYEKILVPLDGSELAECALPHVAKLVKEGATREVTLLSVFEIPTLVLSEGFDAVGIRKSLLDKAQQYLAGLQSQLGKEGVKVKATVLEGRPTQAIVEYSKEISADLIIIATHGYTGMKHLMFGSVALRVLHDAHAPVLLIRPESCR
jgi:nucleotide-binding universal stress UspA family protein